MNKKYYVRKTKTPSRWRTVRLGHSVNVHLRSVDQKIMNRMPSSTNTFVEDNAIKSFVQRMRHFVKTGN